MIRILLISFMYLVSSFSVFADEEKLVVGQIWVYEWGNPFNPRKDSEYKILAVKNGFVQYKNSATGEIDSDGIGYFKLGSYLKKDIIIDKLKSTKD